MTNFKTFLGNLVKSCDRLYGATITGFDGITLSKYFAREVPRSPDVYEAFVAGFSPLVRSFYDRASEMDLGETESLSAMIGNVSFRFKILNDKYFLAVIASKDAYQGKIEYYSSLEAKKFREAFEL